MLLCIQAPTDWLDSNDMIHKIPFPQVNGNFSIGRGFLENFEGNNHLEQK